MTIEGLEAFNCTEAPAFAKVSIILAYSYRIINLTSSRANLAHLRRPV